MAFPSKSATDQPMWDWGDVAGEANACISPNEKRLYRVSHMIKVPEALPKMVAGNGLNVNLC
jgi:hypothetical protein